MFRVLADTERQRACYKVRCANTDNLVLPHRVYLAKVSYLTTSFEMIIFTVTVHLDLIPKFQFTLIQFTFKFSNHRLYVWLYGISKEAKMNHAKSLSYH